MDAWFKRETSAKRKREAREELEAQDGDTEAVADAITDAYGTADGDTNHFEDCLEVIRRLRNAAGIKVKRVKPTAAARVNAAVAAVEAKREPPVARDYKAECKALLKQVQKLHAELKNEKSIAFAHRGNAMKLAIELDLTRKELEGLRAREERPVTQAT